MRTFQSCFDSRWNFKMTSFVPGSLGLCSDCGGVSEDMSVNPPVLYNFMFNNLNSMLSEAFQYILGPSCTLKDFLNTR